MKKLTTILLSTFALSIFMVSPAHAIIDVTSATGAITGDGKDAITAIGTALIGLAGTAVVFKWAKGAIFG